MSLLFFDGFEGIQSQTATLYRYDQKLDDGGVVTTGLTPTPPSRQFYNPGNLGAGGVSLIKIVDNSEEIYVGTRILRQVQGQASYDTELPLIWIMDTTLGSLQNQITITTTTDLGFKVYRGSNTGTLLATSSPNVFPRALWFYFEVCVKVNDTSGKVIIRVDGVEVLSINNINTKNTANNYSNTVRWSDAPGLEGLDDIYILNSLGDSPFNTFLGEIIIEELLPNGAGDLTQFVPLSGTNWQAVDDANVSDNDTTYVQSQTAGATDLYNLSSITRSNATTVLAAKLTTVAIKTTIGDQSLQLSAKIGGITNSSPAIPLINSYNEISYTFEKNFVTNENWTRTELENLQTGFKIPD